ncbi:hypothetical protein [Salinisphaera sp. G21_0]|uniref:hypothetical protein n=1 Tax=Salinisphaera sp. G21_0 TaxID=2821094 RepID=UPI001AD9A439|nr:hypothetical protein [Salinisphaera sp. G21_0]MBO9481308.1 hypothetical protein [Salinisphaera sp. G21_0]
MMEPMSSSHTQIRLNTGDGKMCSDTQPLMVTPTSDQALTDAASIRDGHGKSFVNREVRVIEVSEHSHGVSTRALLKSNQNETAQAALCEGASKEIKPQSAEQVEKKTVLDPEMLTRKLDEIETQIIELTGVYGEIPQKELMRFKLAALYIQENILTRMLYGMASQEEAFSKFQSLGDLLPQSSNGAALMRVLDLWWLPGNEKYFPDKTIVSLKRLDSVSEYLETALGDLNTALGDLNTAVESFDKGRLLLTDKLKKKLIPSEGSSDSSTASSLTSEFFSETEFKEVLGRLLKKGNNECFTASQNRSQVHGSALSDVEDNPCRDESEAVKSNSVRELLEQSSEAMKSDFSLTKLDKLVVIFHHLYQIHNNEMHIESVNLTNIDVLDNYFNELLLETELSVYEKEIACFAFLQSLGHFYHKIAMECKVSCCTGKSNHVKSAHFNKAITYNTKLHKMAMVSIKGDICQGADFWVLSLLASGFLMNYRWTSRDRAQLTSLSLAVERSPKQESEIALAKYTCFSIAELLEDVGAYRSVADNSEKYNTFALLTMLWNDLGFSRWPYSTTLNPEKALEYLEFIRYEITNNDNQSAEMLKQSMDIAYEFNKLMQGSTPISQLYSERIALYYFMLNDPKKALELLKFTKRKSKSLYFGLCMASKREYQFAIQFIEKEKIKDACIKALLGILCERLASSQEESSEQYDELLTKAELNYRAVIGSRPEMNKYLAMLIEKRGYLSDSLKHWKAYRCFLHDQEDKSNIRSVRFKIPMEIKLVGEKILELENLIGEIKSEKKAESLLGDDKSYSEETVKKKPGRQPARKRKGKKKSRPAADRKPACQEQKPPDFHSEKRISIQVPNLESEPDLNSGSEFEGQTDPQHHYQQGLNENQWQLVTGKSDPFRLVVIQGVKIPVGFSIKEVERHWGNTRDMRNNLTNRLLFLDIGRGDYDGVLGLIDQYVGKTENPVAQLHFIQNREWLLRCKSFDNRALYVHCRRSGQTIQALKAELRLSILQCVQKQVESVFQHAFQRLPSPLWFSNPELLKKDIKYLIDHVHPEFCVQVGAQFSTAAHVMRDIHWEFTCQRVTDQTCRSLYGHSPGDYSNLAEKFYKFRDFIDPQHLSDII